jgi:pimeloyl-ACP methyl ester carboxylesterase
MELQWKLPGFADFPHDLSSFARLIRFDKRGTGMSDPVAGAPSLKTRMDDVRAVMDAAGSRRAAFYGLSEGAAMSILFAATYPERTAALVVRSCSPRMVMIVCTVVRHRPLRRRYTRTSPLMTWRTSSFRWFGSFIRSSSETAPEASRRPSRTRRACHPRPSPDS